MKKIFGIILLLIGTILILAFLVRFMSFLTAILDLGKIYSQDLSANEIGQIFGKLVFWIIYIGLTYFSLKYGSKYLKKSK